MQFIPADAYQYMHMMGGGTFPVVSGSEMAQYAAWVETQTPQSSATPTTTAASHTSFYFVLAFPQGDYADKIDDSANYPMWVPASGTTPKILGIFSDEKEATVKMDEDVENVHVMYQCRLGGRDEITEFLEFMAEHDMLAPTSGR